jgi:hypothetical protein
MDTGTWVPLVTAAAGLIAGLVSTILARRWAREDRTAAWQREDALRWHADRLQVYAPHDLRAGSLGALLAVAARVTRYTPSPGLDVIHPRSTAEEG